MITFLAYLLMLGTGVMGSTNHKKRVGDKKEEANEHLEPNPQPQELAGRDFSQPGACAETRSSSPKVTFLQ